MVTIAHPEHSSGELKTFQSEIQDDHMAAIVKIYSDFLLLNGKAT